MLITLDELEQYRLKQLATGLPDVCLSCVVYIHSMQPTNSTGVGAWNGVTGFQGVVGFRVCSWSVTGFQGVWLE